MMDGKNLNEASLGVGDSEISLKIYCDGGSHGNPGPAASAFVVEEDGKIIFKKGESIGIATNNIAEYRAVLLAFSWLEKNLDHIKNKTTIFFLDSELVTRQLNGLYKIKNENLRNLFYSIKEKERKIKPVINKIFYRHIPREKNIIADFLVNKNFSS